MSVVKSDDNQFIIPFVGLKRGKHEFTFDITDAFFETFEYSIIQKGDVHINFVLDKKDTMMVGEFQLEGRVKTACDRCNDSIEISIEGEFKLVYKFAKEDEEDESIVVIFPEEFELNIKNTLLEFMNVLLPSRSIHDEGECNEEMLDFLNEYIVNPLDEDEDDFDDEDYDDDDSDDFDEDDEDNQDLEEEEEADAPHQDIEENEDRPIDPRWEALRNLKK
jgi:uncharacterized metal-binding protein YceD (DUF177 family)